MSSDKLVDLVVHMDSLKQQIEKLGAEKTRLQKQYDALRFKEIPNVMEPMGIEKMSISGIGTVYLEGNVDVNIPAAVRDDAYQYVEEVLESGEIIKPFIQSSTLKASGKKWILAGYDLPEDLFKVSTYQLAKILRK